MRWMLLLIFTLLAGAASPALAGSTDNQQAQLGRHHSEGHSRAH
jgi:hypothetical protein